MLPVFLDVLFPLSLKKIVFVDADQIVRTDLKDLFDLDLEGNIRDVTKILQSSLNIDILNRESVWLYPVL